MTTYYTKTDGLSPTTRKPTGHNSWKTRSDTIPTNIHTANNFFTTIILMADKHNIPKGKMHINCRLLPNHIVCKITQRNNVRRANTCDPAVNPLNDPTYKTQTNILKEHLDAHRGYRHNTHTL